MNLTFEMVEAVAEALRVHAPYNDHRLSARAALEAALAVEGTPEPVAWRWRYKNTEWVYLEDRPTWFEDEAGNERFEAEPLYTTPPAGIREALEVIESFIAETVDYMTRNNLGDPEKQHNVRWGRKVLAALRGQS